MAAIAYIEKATELLFNKSKDANENLRQMVFFLSLLSGIFISLVSSILYILGILPFKESIVSLIGFTGIGIIVKYTRNVKLGAQFIFILSFLLLLSAMLDTGGIYSILSVWFVSFLIFINFLLPNRIILWTGFLMCLLIALYFFYDPVTSFGYTPTFALVENILALVTALCGILVYNWITNQNKKEIQTQQEALAQVTKELREKNASLLQNTEKLKAVNEQLEKFAQVVSHDLKTPLRSIIGFSQLAVAEAHELKNEQLKKHLNFVSTSGLQMAELIDDILTLSATNPDLTLESSTLELKSILEELKISMSESLSKRNARLNFQENIPAIKGNSTQIKRLLQNLIDNGLKYNESPLPSVNIEVQKSNTYVELFISDNGVGIDTEHFDEIFRYKQRLTHHQYLEGSGMGLAICKDIVEAMNGSIQIKSELGKGSTFIIFIPQKD